MVNVERQNSLVRLLKQAQASARNEVPSFSNVASIREEMRSRRKRLIGSFISLEELVRQSEAVDEAVVEDLSDYLAQRSAVLWTDRNKAVGDIFRTFYSLAITALVSGNVGFESVDDIIQLAECLVRSRDTFAVVMRDLLPADRIGELFRFISEENNGFFTAGFEDVVLGSVSVLLGALEDPTIQEDENEV